MKNMNIVTFAVRIVFLLLFFAMALPGNAYKFDFTTVGDVVDQVKNKFRSLDSYQAQFSITSTRTGKKTQQSGVIKYKNPGRLLIEYHSPQGQKVVSNGKSMWVYIPSMNVVAEQDLMSDSGLFSSASKSGLDRLFLKYHYRFASKDQPEKMSSGEKKYTMILKQKERKSGYRTIKLWISEDYFIERARGETSTGKEVEITFSNIQTDINLPNGIFKFDMPARARTIKNPMIAEE
jgi:outer membrane lipoprotein-sorting protein